MYNIEQATPTDVSTSWYVDMKQFHNHGAFPSHYQHNKRTLFDLKLYHSGWYMQCSFGSTIKGSFLDVWMHQIQKGCYMLFMMDQSMGITWVIVLHTKSWRSFTIRLYLSRMLMLMPASVQFVRNVLVMIGSRLPHYNPLF